MPENPPMLSWGDDSDRFKGVAGVAATLAMVRSIISDAMRGGSDFVSDNR